MDVLELVGRLVFATLFLFYGVIHFTRFGFMAGYARAKGTPFPRVAVAGTGLMLIAGGALVALGVWPDLGALVLVAFLVPVAFVIHPFWRETDPVARAGEESVFLKDLALAGASLTLFALFSQAGEPAYALTHTLF